MNIIKSFNNTINYIETSLESEIDERKIMYLSGYSYQMFSRLFSILTELKLSEYIRARKLTEAAILLRDTDKKILDIAMIFGYETSDSFGVAFKNFHGYTPSQVRKGHPFKVFSKIQLAISVRGGKKMNIRIEKKGPMIVAGMNEQKINSSLCNNVWQKLYSKFCQEKLKKLGNGESVGVCHDILSLENHDIENSNLINYMAGYIIDDVDEAEKMGLDILKIEAAEYAVVELKGKIPDCIHEGWKYFMEVFCPEYGYIHSGAPDFEYYYEGDMNSSDYEMELWIPIKKDK